MKRFLASLLAVFMLVSALPVSAFAAEPGDANTAAVADTQEPAQVVAQQLVLGDNLNMRFLVKANSTNAILNITVGNEETKSISLQDVQQDEQGNCIINVALAAAQMTDTITLQATADGVTGTAKQYTVRGYAEKLMGGNYAKQTTELVRAMLNYGAYAQVYFGYNADKLANAGYESDLTVTLPEAQTVAVYGAVDGISFYSATLSFRDRVALRCYFRGDISGMTVAAGEKPFTVGQKDGLSYVELEGINPQDYSTVYTVSVSNGTDTLSVDYSAMHYISRMGVRGSENLQNLLKSLFVYHNAAIAYNAWIASCDNLADFIVVYGDDATDNEIAARDMIVEYIQKASGVTLPMIPASQVENMADANYLLVGDTGLGDMTPAKELGSRGFRILSKDGDIFVCGGTDYGTLCGAIRFLEEIINLQAFGHKIVHFNMMSELWIDRFDLTVVPDIDVEQPPFAFVTSDSKNMALWGIGGTMFGLIEGSTNNWHNSFDYLPPAQYSAAHPEYYVWNNGRPVQLSYTANGNAAAFEEMTTICANKIISAAVADSSLKALTLTQQDDIGQNGTWDTCDAEQALYAKYGTHSAGVIIFLNAVADKVKAGLPEGRELDIYFFAYQMTVDPPQNVDSDVQMRDNVGVLFAPGDDFSSNDFYSTQMYRQLTDWAALTDNLGLWTYQSNFDDYFVFYNSFNTSADIYKAAAQYGVKYRYDLGQWNNAFATGFSDLKAYLNGKLSWNVNADMDELLDGYFATRFGSAETQMRTLFNEMRAYFDQLKATYNISGKINHSAEYLRADRFEKEVLERWLGYIDEALAKADNDAIRQHILMESLSVRYMWLELYGDTMSNGDRVIAIYAFKKDCTDLYVTMWSEIKPVTELWERWEDANMTMLDGYAYNFDLSLNQSEYRMPIPEAVSGAVVGVYDADYKALEGVTIGEDTITVPAAAVSAMLDGRPYGDCQLHLTTADTIYKVNVAVVTKMIGSYSDLVAIKANQVSSVLDGYYALANDIDATGENAVCLIDFDGYINNKENSGVGFVGIFDGRGHTISNLTVKTGGYAKVGGLFGQILEGATVRDVAFMDMTTDGATAYTYLLTGESCRMMGKMENVVVSAKGDVSQAFGFVGCDLNNTASPARFTMQNIIISGVDYLAFSVKLPNALNNVICVANSGVVKEMSASGEDKAATNAIVRYNTNDAMFAALTAENILAQWENSGIAYENSAITFHGKAIITELMNVVENEAVIGTTTNLTVEGNIALTMKEAVSGVSLNGNALTVDNAVKDGTKIVLIATSNNSGTTKEFVINLVRNYRDVESGVSLDVEVGAESAAVAITAPEGAVETLRYGSKAVSTGYTLTDGTLTLSKELLDHIYAELGCGEHTLSLCTDANIRYNLKLAIVTKVINTVADLESIATNEATLDGYYVLNNDLDCTGKTISLLAGQQAIASNVGFKGTFDGRGHVISNLTTTNVYNKLSGVFGQLCTGSVVKNVAFTNLNSNGPDTKVLLVAEGSNLYGTLEDVAVIGADSTARVLSSMGQASGKLNQCFFANVYQINIDGGKAAVSNILSATANASPEWGGFSWTGNSVYDAQPNYASVDALIGALESGETALWEASLFAYADGQILFNGKVIAQYDLYLEGESIVYLGTEQNYVSDGDVYLKDEIDGVSLDYTDTDESGRDIYTLTVAASVPAGTKITLVAQSWDFASVTEELVVTVQKLYTDVDLTAEGSKADIPVTGSASVQFPYTVEGIGYGGSAMVTEGFSYADGTLNLTGEVVAAMASATGLGEQTLKLYTVDGHCYAVTVTLVTKIINTVADLESIATNEATLDGYYVLNNDLDCTGKTISLLAGQQTIASNVGFKGTFDGRGHVISNLTTTNVYNRLSGVFGQLCTGSVVKNVAFTNLDSNGPDGKVLLVAEGSNLYGTLENVAVIGADSTARVLSSMGQASGKLNQCFFANVYQINIDGGKAAVSNILSATANARPNWGGFSWTGNSVYDKQPNYTTVSALIEALASGSVSVNAPFTYDNGRLLFNDKLLVQAPISLSGANVIVRGTSQTYTSDGVITLKNAIEGVSVVDGVLSVDYSVAEDTVITLVATHSSFSAVTTEMDVVVSAVYEQIDLTSLGSIGDLETAEANTEIALPAQIDGNVTGISYGDTAKFSGVSVTDGVLSIPNAWVTEVYNAYGYGEQSIKLYTDTDKSYTVTITVVTKAIANQADLQSIATTGNTLDGYYVLTEDISCDGTSFKLVGTWSGSTSTGFVGTFDGRGHIIDGYNGSTTGLFYCTGAKAVIKNVAFTNATGNSVLAGTETHGSTFDNIFVSGDAQYLCKATWHSAVYKNIVFASGNASAAMLGEGSNSVITMTNVFVVGARLYDYLNTPPSTSNAQCFTDSAAMLAAFGAEGELDQWSDSSFNFADGKLYFGENVVCQETVSLSGAEVIVRGTSETYTSNGIISLKEAIDGVTLENGVLSVDYSVAEDTVITLVATHSSFSAVTTEMEVVVSAVYEQIDLTSLGSIGDLETAEDSSLLTLPEGVSGDVTGISYGDTAKFSGVSVTDGVLSIPNAWVTQVYNAYGYGEQSIKLYTDADKSYTVTVSVITKALASQEDLLAIANPTGKLDGYFALTDDIVCDGTTVIQLSCYTSTLDSGFIGTFDGRGHTISNANVGNKGFFRGIGAGTVKNVAFVNVISSTTNALAVEIHGSTLENVFVSTNAKGMFDSHWDSPTYQNVVFVSAQTDGKMVGSGNKGVLTMRNVFAVSSVAHGWWGGSTNETNTKAFSNTDALLAAFGAEGELDQWSDSSFTYVDGQLLFNGKLIVQ